MQGFNDLLKLFPGITQEQEIKLEKIIRSAILKYYCLGESSINIDELKKQINYSEDIINQ